MKRLVVNQLAEDYSKLMILNIAAETCKYLATGNSDFWKKQINNIK